MSEHSILAKLHNAARWYCVTQSAHWVDAYLQLERAGKSRVKDNTVSAGWDYSEAAYALFPRYRLDDAILVEVEKLVPSCYGSEEELRQALRTAGEQAGSNLTREFGRDAVAMSALNTEGAAFAEYVMNVTPSQLKEVELLPYRRVLSQAESDRLWTVLRNRWGVGHGEYWYPLTENSKHDAVAFHQEFWELREGERLLTRALEERNIKKCFVLRELGPPDYEVSTASLNCTYDGSEKFITSDGSWMIYSSHESSITVAGWLTGWFRREWMDADLKTYKGPFHTDDLRGTWQA